MKKLTYKRSFLLLWFAWVSVAVYLSIGSFREDRTFYVETEQETLADAKQYRDREWCDKLVQHNLREVEKFKTRTFFDDYLKTFQKNETDEQWYARRQAKHEAAARQFANQDWCEMKAKYLEEVAAVYREMGTWRPFFFASTNFLVLAGFPWLVHAIVFLIFTVIWKPLKQTSKPNKELKATGKTSPEE